MDYFGVREVMYCILYKETSNCRRLEYFGARESAQHKAWCVYSTHIGPNIGDKLQKKEGSNSLGLAQLSACTTCIDGKLQKGTTYL